MTTKELIDYLLDNAGMGDEVVISMGEWDDFDEYNDNYTDLTECCVTKSIVHLFADFKGDAHDER